MLRSPRPTQPAPELRAKVTTSQLGLLVVGSTHDTSFFKFARRDQLVWTVDSAHSEIFRRYLVREYAAMRLALGAAHFAAISGVLVSYVERRAFLVGVGVSRLLLRLPEQLQDPDLKIDHRQVSRRAFANAVPFRSSTVLKAKGDDNAGGVTRSRSSCRTTRDAVKSKLMDGKIDIRVPRKMLNELERERKRLSKEAGVEVKTSAVIRSILELHLRSKRRHASSERAA